MRHMRDIGFQMAQLIYTKHMPDAHKDDQYWIAVLNYAEAIAQTNIMAGVSPGDLNEQYYDLKES